MVSSISSTTNKDENGISSWEKTVQDVNDIDEKFSTARDMGYTRRLPNMIPWIITKFRCSPTANCQFRCGEPKATKKKKCLTSPNMKKN